MPQSECYPAVHESYDHVSRLVAYLGRVRFQLQHHPAQLGHFTMYRPFKPPLLKNFAPRKAIKEERIPESDDESEVRPYKKRKLVVHGVNDPSPVKPVAVSAAVLDPRKPLLAIKNSIEPKAASQSSNDCPEGYYMVLWYVNTIQPIWI